VLQLFFRISQGTLATFYRSGGQISNFQMQHFFRILCIKNYWKQIVSHRVIRNI